MLAPNTLAASLNAPILETNVITLLTEINRALQGTDDPTELSFITSTQQGSIGSIETSNIEAKITYILNRLIILASITADPAQARFLVENNGTPVLWDIRSRRAPILRDLKPAHMMAAKLDIYATLALANIYLHQPEAVADTAINLIPQLLKLIQMPDDGQHSRMYQSALQALLKITASDIGVSTFIAARGIRTLTSFISEDPSATDGPFVFSYDDDDDNEEESAAAVACTSAPQIPTQTFDVSELRAPSTWIPADGLLGFLSSTEEESEEEGPPAAAVSAIGKRKRDATPSAAALACTSASEAPSNRTLAIEILNIAATSLAQQITAATPDTWAAIIHDLDRVQNLTDLVDTREKTIRITLIPALLRSTELIPIIGLSPMLEKLRHIAQSAPVCTEMIKQDGVIRIINSIRCVPPPAASEEEKQLWRRASILMRDKMKFEIIDILFSISKLPLGSHAITKAGGAQLLMNFFYNSGRYQEKILKSLTNLATHSADAQAIIQGDTKFIGTVHDRANPPEGPTSPFIIPSLIAAAGLLLAAMTAHATPLDALSFYGQSNHAEAGAASGPPKL